MKPIETRPEPEADESRRAFLKRLAQASALAVAAGGLTGALIERGPPPLTLAPKTLTTLGDFTPAKLKNAPAKLVAVRGSDQDSRAAMFDLGAQALGGADGIGAFIARGDRVLLKVNAAFATSPALGATTHPDLIAAVTRACLAAGAAWVGVTDNPINDPAACFKVSGIEEAATASGAKILLPRPDLFRAASLPAQGSRARLIRDWPVLAGVFAGVTKVICLTPVKDHARAGASMSLKNLYGLLGGRRNVFHQEINGIIAELGQLLTPTLYVLDGVVAMRSNGPTGGSLSDLARTNMLILSRDPVAADSFGCALIERTPADLPYLRLAAAAGVGSLETVPEILDMPSLGASQGKRG